MQDWISLLIQIPLVGIFIWFVLKKDEAQVKRDDEWRKFLKQESDAREESCKASMASVEKLAISVNGNSDKIAEVTKSVANQTAVTLYTIARKTNNGDEITIRELVDLLTK